jgi:hypothetical protein
MIFSYWCADRFAQQYPAEGEAEWSLRQPAFRIFTDEQVVPLLARWGDRAASLFNDVRIPACKADVARLALLYVYGGLYVDAHCAPGSDAGLAGLLQETTRRELVLFDECAQDPHFRGTGILNSILCARAGSEILDTLVRKAVANLDQQRKAERSGRGLDYSIYKLTGPWIIWHQLFLRIATRGELRPEYRDRIAVWPYHEAEAIPPVLTYRYNSYRRPAIHWSRRQRTEPLFFSTALTA